MANNVDPVDCAAVMNFYAAPPTIDYQTTPDFLKNNYCGMRRGEPQHKHAKRIIASNRNEGSATGIAVFTGSGDNVAALIMDFPGSHLLCGPGKQHRRKRGT